MFSVAVTDSGRWPLFGDDVCSLIGTEHLPVLACNDLLVVALAFLWA